MRNTIRRILAQRGFIHQFTTSGESTTFHLSIDNPPWTRLVIERTSPTEVSVCHYVEQNGDLCQDPEITFRTQPGEHIWDEPWAPSTFTNALLGIHQHAYPIVDGVQMVRPRLVKDLQRFSTTWARTLIGQGFHLPTCVLTSNTHESSLTPAQRLADIDQRQPTIRSPQLGART